MRLQIFKRLNSSKSVFFTLAFLCLFSASSKASYMVATPKGASLSVEKNKPVHVLVTGHGNELMDLFARAAIVQADVLKANNPDSTIIILAYDENSNVKTMLSQKYDVRSPKNATGSAGGIFGGGGNNSVTQSSLSMSNIKDELKSYKQIASIHIFAHNSPIHGSVLDGVFERAKPDDQHLVDLKSKFMPLTYIKFHGCNTGDLVAPSLASTLGIPVIGSLTSTDFQFRSTQNQWFYEVEGFYPTGTQHSTVMPTADGKKTPCAGDVCYRLMPSPSSYEGYWGVFRAGLPYFKVFCPTPAQNASSDVVQAGLVACQKVAATAFMEAPSVASLKTQFSKENLAAVLADQFCSHRKTFAQCASEVAAVLNGQKNSIQTSGFQSDLLECGPYSCNLQLKCEKSKILFFEYVKPKSCTIDYKTSADPMTREILFIVNGLRALGRQI